MHDGYTMDNTLIIHIAANAGFENASATGNGTITLSSARHETSAMVNQWLTGMGVIVQSPYPELLPTLSRNVPPWPSRNDQFYLTDLEQLASFLRQTAQLSLELRKQSASSNTDPFSGEDTHSVSKTDTDPSPDGFPPASPQETEIERLRRERIGQDIYRRAQMSYWHGGCAVTGITLPEVLRASHAKPWAECTNDAERLDVFNGFLLVANLDALFDRFLISFDEGGNLLTRSRLPATDMQALGLHPEMKLRWIEKEHLPYLHWHRQRFLAVNCCAPTSECQTDTHDITSR